ncbi:mediator complex, subunit Med10 [Chytridium lagenaria]|nr:mediator complex, subunit Med10 [Chytridium lagenaria]
MDAAQQKLQDFVNLLFRIGVTVYDFQPGSGPILHRRINDLAAQMEDLEKIKNQLNDIRVPFNLISHIEEGHNPDIYTKDLIQHLVDRNQKTNGRIQTMKQFRSDLEREILANFPDLHDTIASLP